MLDVKEFDNKVTTLSFVTCTSGLKVDNPVTRGCRVPLIITMISRQVKSTLSREVNPSLQSRKKKPQEKTRPFVNIKTNSQKQFIENYDRNIDTNKLYP